MTRTFKETPWFTKRWYELGFDDEALMVLQNMILENPETGDLIRGSGGVRKLRFAFVGRGKSGSARVCYVDFERYETVYLIAVYKKAEKENLTLQERNDIKKLVAVLKAEERIISNP